MNKRNSFPYTLFHLQCGIPSGGFCYVSKPQYQKKFTLYTKHHITHPAKLKVNWKSIWFVEMRIGDTDNEQEMEF